MDITTTQSGDLTKLRLKGRLDAYWSDHVGAAIEQVVRGGAHHLELNFADVDYLSSAGIRVLLQYYKSLKAIKGSLRVTEPSVLVAKTLSLSGFDAMLIPSAAGGLSGKPEAPEQIRRLEKSWGTIQVHEQSPGAFMSCEVIGKSEPLFSGTFAKSDCVLTAFPEQSIGFGLGAFGTNFADCQNRFGEFMALGGAALAMPTDGSNTPDHIISNQNLVPELQVLYGIKASGQFSHIVRFDCRPEPGSSVSIPDLAETAFELANSPTVCLSILAECGALVGASLRRSPVLANGTNPLLFPDVRDWVSLTTERTNDRHVALITGIVSKSSNVPFGSMLRPLSRDAATLGHFHAAIFAYRPLARGVIKLHEAVTSLMNTDSAQALLHLLCDDRPFEGIGQSELFRGACWVGRVAQTPAQPT